MSFPRSDFWDFSTRVYAQPGVAAACLRLQDRHGVDVNMLLFALWAAARGVVLDPTTLVRAQAVVTDWQTEVVQPLRAVRRELKNEPRGAPPALVTQVRERVKAAELDAEHVEQLMLAACLPSVTEGADRADWDRMARRNSLAYLEVLGVELAGEDAAAFDLVVASASGTPEATA